MNSDNLDPLRQQIAACTVCAAHLPHGVRPVVRFSATARLVIIGQAPGTRVHESGVPWDDVSGARLREWIGLAPDVFYDRDRVAIVPMGFCYPGTGTSGDLPPRPECAPLWHDRIFAHLPSERVTLLVGSYAQARYLPQAKRLSLTERVRCYADFAPAYFPLPHPSWRSTGWLKRNRWFQADILPVLKQQVLHAVS